MVARLSDNTADNVPGAAAGDGTGDAPNGNDGTNDKMRWVYARALYEDDRATLDNLREAVATLEETERTARRVLGGAHPATEGIEFHLREARAALRARENAATGDPD